MRCDNCPGTVWFDHAAKLWQHGSGSCASPVPYFPHAERPVALPKKTVRRVQRG